MKSKFLRINLLIVLTISAMALSSCLKDEDAERRAEEKRIIENYIGTHYPGAQPTSSGLYIITETEGDVDGKSPKLEDNDIFIINYKGKYLESGSIFDTSDSLTAQTADIFANTYMEYNGPLKTSYIDSESRFNFYSLGVIEGLGYMKEGGKYTLIMPSLLAFNDYRPVIFEVELLKVIENAKIKEFELEHIGKYISNWNKTFADSTRTEGDTLVGSLFFNVDSPATGPKPKVNQTVTVNYSLKLLPYQDDNHLNVTERMIQKKDNYKIVLSKSQTIEGFFGAVRNMQLGETSTWVIPYWRGYGENRLYNPSSYRVALPQYATLVYQIKLVKIE